MFQCAVNLMQFTEILRRKYEEGRIRVGEDLEDVENKEIKVLIGRKRKVF